MILAAGLLVVIIVLLGLLIRRNIYIAAPDEPLVFTGLQRSVLDAATGERRSVSHRLMTGGSAFRMPVLERVDRIPLAEMSIRPAVDDVYDREGRTWRLRLLVNARVFSSAPGVERAIERFLGMSPGEIESVLRSTSEARLRNVLVTHDLAERPAWPELERELSDLFTADAGRLGIQIDTLIIESPPVLARPEGPVGGAPRRNSGR